ncbi:Sjoegren syndrome nuclear autoantigen 1 isoform X2 [Cryptotermes secundus]|nr:Sjoegren syndrome nuclear autoantigen 1 isoform X2 [Cryptotermes secundus]
MKRKRSELQQLIDEQEDEKITLQREIEKMSFRLAQINASLSQMTAARSKYDHTIAETEAAYTKILESSQVLLNMVRTEASCLEQILAKKINVDESHSLGWVVVSIDNLARYDHLYFGEVARLDYTRSLRDTGVKTHITETD